MAATTCRHPVRTTGAFSTAMPAHSVSRVYRRTGKGDGEAVDDTEGAGATAPAPLVDFCGRAAYFEARKGGPVSEWASQLRRNVGRGSGRWLPCVVCLVAVPAASAAGGTTALPDAPPASARIGPVPDAPPVAGARPTSAPVRRATASWSAARPVARGGTSGGSVTGSRSRDTPSAAATGRRIVAPTETPRAKPVARVPPTASRASSPRPRAAAEQQRLAAPAAMAEPLGPKAEAARDRGMIAIAGALLAIAAIGGAVLGRASRRVFRRDGSDTHRDGSCGGGHRRPVVRRRGGGFRRRLNPTAAPSRSRATAGSAAT